MSLYIYTNVKPNPNKCYNRKTGLSKKLNSSNALYLMETMKLLMKFQRSFEFALFTQRFQRSFLSSLCSHFLLQAPFLSLSLSLSLCKQFFMFNYCLWIFFFFHFFLSFSLSFISLFVQISHLVLILLFGILMGLCQFRNFATSIV